MNESTKSQSSDCMPTTIDNPYNPFTQFDDWYRFDEESGYNTWRKIDRLMPSNVNSLSPAERAEFIELAIDRLAELLPGIYLKVVRTDADNIGTDSEKFVKFSQFSKNFS